MLCCMSNERDVRLPNCRLGVRSLVYTEDLSPLYFQLFCNIKTTALNNQVLLQTIIRTDIDTEWGKKADFRHSEYASICRIEVLLHGAYPRGHTLCLK